MTQQRRALISVSNKNHLADFAKSLQDLDFEIVSTGGTAATLRDAGITVIDVAEVTGFPEIMGGRVKTLHPKIHGGLLARPHVDDAALAAHGIAAFDLLVVNLYPFEQVIAKADVEFADAIENIDIGGPAMLRAAAKNHGRMTVVVHSGDYTRVAEAFRIGEPSPDLRRSLAAKAFAHTARYDAIISRFLAARDVTTGTYPATFVGAWNNAGELRYGENPHQAAALYLDPQPVGGSVAQGKLLQGKALSYNNLLDADAAMRCTSAFAEPACVIVKHMNPCGAAIATDIACAYEKAFAGDPTSAFGGIIAFNRELDAATAKSIVSRQLVDVVVAPVIGDEARAALAVKPNTRVIETGSLPSTDSSGLELRSIAGGLLVQQPDTAETHAGQLEAATQRKPSEAEIADLLFAWSVARYVKSNAIVYAKDGRTLGIGAGQTSRVMSARIAGLKAEEQQLDLAGAVMASDAFLPFRDGLDTAAAFGIRAVIQPGGSIRDKEVVEAADEHGIAMVFTGMRHFRH